MAGSWWLYRSVTGQSMAPWSIYKSAPPFSPADDSTATHFREVYPDRAPGPQRAAAGAYQGLLSAPQIADTAQPTARPVFPDRSLGPARTSASAYGGNSAENIADANQPPGTVHVASPFFPDKSNAIRRAANTAYQTWSSQVSFGLPLNAPAQGVQFYPAIAAAAPRTGNQAYQVIVKAPAGDPPTPGTPVIGQPIWPDRANSVPRAANTAYSGSLSTPINTTPPGPPMGPPSNYPWMSDPQRIPLRATADSYRGLLSRPVQGDNKEPSGSPSWPSMAAAGQRASSVAYVGLLSRPVLASGTQPIKPVFPDRINAAPRSIATSYQIIVQPQIADRGNLSGREVYPSIIFAPRRADATSYYIQQQGRLPMPPAPVATRPFYPDRAPGPPRAVNDAYKGLLSQPVRADGVNPARPFWPDRALVAARAASSVYHVALQSPPTDTHATPGHPLWPDFARIAARAAFSAYAGMLSQPVHADGNLPPARPVVSDPQRSSLRSVASSYNGLLSSEALPDHSMPQGLQTVFPLAAYSQNRASPQAYIHVGNPHPPSVFHLSVASTFNLQAEAFLGNMYILDVSVDLNLQPVIIQGPGGGLDTRYRQGDEVPISFAPPFTPTQGTTLTVTPIGGSTAETTPLWTWDNVNWQTNLLVTNVLPPGDYNAQWVATNAIGTTSLQWVQFSIVSGGDPGSSVIAIYAQDSPDGRVILAQLRSGALVRGQGPWV